MTLRLLLGLAPGLASIVVAVWCTYALHAVAWWGAVVALARRSRPPSTRHRLWKLALVGPCVTAPIAALAPWTFGPVVAARGESLRGLARAARAAGGSAFASQTGPSWFASWSSSSWASSSASWLALGLALAAGLGLMRFALAFVRLRR